MNALSPATYNADPCDIISNELVAEALEARMGNAPAAAVIGAAFGRFGDRFVLVSSFGAESAVLLHLAASVSKDIQVLFLDTGKLFGETKRYRDTLIRNLGLKNVQTISPDEEDLIEEDPKGHLWHSNYNRCCFIRKVKPLHKVLEGFDAWATGRKRFQGGLRQNIGHFEASDGRIKVNPLAHWDSTDVKNYQSTHHLPQHPLVSEGFGSIGCMPCTDRINEGENVRAGRWRGSAKSECGIHLNMSQNLSILDKSH